MDKYDNNSFLKELFTTQLQKLLDSLDGTKPDTVKRNDGDTLIITISHPSNKRFDIVVTVDEEIIVFFDDFHTHCENYSNDSPVEEIVQDVIIYLQHLLTADQIIITKLSKGTYNYKNVLEIVTGGNRKVIDCFYVGFAGLLFFLPKRKVSLSTNFKQPGYKIDMPMA
jgi:hypothetical protein